MVRRWPCTQAPEGKYIYVGGRSATNAARRCGGTAGTERSKEGIKPGETIVIDGQLRLVPGSRISIKGGTPQKADS